MRAKEFTINVPITISINGDEDPVVSAGNQDSPEEDDLQLNPVMVPPLQQSLELSKAAAGKDSPIIDKITQDESEKGEETPEELQEVGAETTDADTELLQRLKALIGR